MTSSLSPSHLTTPPQVVPLLNSVIDVCVVYGIDETSARELPVTEEGVGRGGGWLRGRGVCGGREGESMLVRSLVLHMLL